MDSELKAQVLFLLLEVTEDYEEICDLVGIEKEELAEVIQELHNDGHIRTYTIH